MAVWLVGPPASVTKPAICWSRKCTVSAGDKSWAMMMVSSNKSVLILNGLLSPNRLWWIRSATCSISCLRSRRYSSSMASNCSLKRSVWIFSAHSALMCCSLRMSTGSRDRVTSVSNIKCSEINAPSSVGAFSGMLLRNSSSCLRVALMAASKRVTSAAMSPSAKSCCGTSSNPRTIRRARPMAMPFPADTPCNTMLMFYSPSPK